MRTRSWWIAACAVWSFSALGCSDESAKHWSVFEQCTIGKPLQKDENVFTRIRGIQLAESLKSVGKPEDWPNRCAASAKALYDSLGTSGKPGMVRRALGEQLGCQEEGCVFPAQGHPLIAADKLWESASYIERVPVEGVAPPAEPITSLTMAGWPSFLDSKVARRRWSDSGELWLLTDVRVGDGKLCRIKGTKVACEGVDGAPEFHTRHPLRLALDAKDPIIVGRVVGDDGDPKTVGYSVAAKKTVDVFGEPMYAAHDGVGISQRPVTVGEDATGKAPPLVFDVHRMKEGRAEARTTLKVTARVRGPDVVAGWLAYVERDSNDEHLFRANELRQDGAVFGQSVEYSGDFPGPFNTCTSKSGAAISSFVDPARQLDKPASGKQKLTAVILHQGKWAAPVSAEIPKKVGQMGPWSCGDGWGAFSWLEQVDRDVKITRLECTADQCKRTEAAWNQPDLRNALGLGAIGKKVVYVYQSTARDTRIKVAPIGELENAQARLAFESDDFGGVSTMVPTLVYGSGMNYLLVEDDELRALTIDAAGATAAVKP